MGCIPSKGMGGKAVKVDESTARAKNDAIEAQIRKDRVALRNEMKMLLLGAGESGKSTIIKQMKLLYQGTYSERERLAFKEVIWSNTIQSMQVVMDAMEAMGLELASEKEGEWADLVLDQPEHIEGASLGPELAEAIIGLWEDEGVQTCVARSNEFQLNDSAIYYFENAKRIGARDYVPTDQDILRSRVKTTGITETVFSIGQLNYKVVDVGGQRSERKKWIHCFEDVSVLIFMIAINEYDQMLYEDESVNRMAEASVLFDSVVNSQWFSRAALILFLNKTDLVRTKLITSPISRYFPEYKGDNSYSSACDFMLGKFKAMYHGKRQLYHHFTCATDTKQVEIVIAAVNDFILQTNLKLTGMV